MFLQEKRNVALALRRIPPKTGVKKDRKKLLTNSKMSDRIKKDVDQENKT